MSKPDIRSSQTRSVLALCNQKGGCGKTTAAVNLAADFAKLGRKTLLVDADYQANATNALDVARDARRDSKLLSRGLLDRVPASEIVLPTGLDNLWVAAGDMKLLRINNMRDELGTFWLLSKWLESTDFDIVVIDSHPGIDLLLTVVLTAANYYAMPLFPETDCFDGLSLMLDQVETVRSHLNPSLFFLGLIISRFNAKSTAHRKVSDKIHTFGAKADMPILGTIPESVAVANASLAAKPLVNFKPDLPVSSAYMELADVLIRELRGPRRGRTVKTPHVEEHEIDAFIINDAI